MTIKNESEAVVDGYFFANKHINFPEKTFTKLGNEDFPSIFVSGINDRAEALHKIFRIFS